MRVQSSLVAKGLGWVFLIAMAAGFVSSNAWLFIAGVVLSLAWLIWTLRAAHVANSRQTDEHAPEDD